MHMLLLLIIFLLVLPSLECDEQKKTESYILGKQQIFFNNFDWLKLFPMLDIKRNGNGRHSRHLIKYLFSLECVCACFSCQLTVGVRYFGVEQDEMIRCYTKFTQYLLLLNSFLFSFLGLFKSLGKCLKLPHKYSVGWFRSGTYS